MNDDKLEFELNNITHTFQRYENGIIRYTNSNMKGGKTISGNISRRIFYTIENISKLKDGKIKAYQCMSKFECDIYKKFCEKNMIMYKIKHRIQSSIHTLDNNNTYEYYLRKPFYFCVYKGFVPNIIRYSINENGVNFESKRLKCSDSHPYVYNMYECLTSKN
jgi:hypothetical protein